MNTADKYGITDDKKSMLDELAIEVIEAQYEVEQFQAIVTSLTEKSQNLGSFLTYQEANRARTLNNKNLLDQVVQNAANLKSVSETAFNEMTTANSGAGTTATQIKSLADKLIYSVEVVNKLSNMIIRKKALNPLISDELVKMVTTAGADANNAVALTLVALKSSFVAQAANLGSEAAASLEFSQSIKLYEILTENPPDVTGAQKKCLKDLLYEAYETAAANYAEAYKANAETLGQLNIATANLNKAQVKLKSLQAGLAAANAAALAS